MPRNGSGIYNLPAGNPVITGTTISSAWANNTLSDIGTGLTNSLAKDGQTVPTANLPMGGFKFTNLGAGSSTTDSANLGQIQSQTFSWLSSVAGSDTITCVSSPVTTSYAAGQTFRFVAAGTNTGPVTININGLGAKAITRFGASPLQAGDIASGAVIAIGYDGTQFQAFNLSSTVTTTNTVTLTNKTLTSPTINTATVGGVWTAGSAWTLPAFTLGGTVTLNGQSFSGTCANGGVFTTIDINGGTVDATIIGGASAAAGTFTTLTATGLTTTNGQIKFPAVQNPSSDANTLDDYEEFSWTPVLTYSTPGNLSVTYSQQVGRGVKIGGWVILSGHIVTSAFSHTTASGDLRVTGNPFSAANITNLNTIGSVSWGGITKANYTQVCPRIAAGSNIVDFIASGSGQAASSVIAADTPTGGTVSLRFLIAFPDSNLT